MNRNHWHIPAIRLTMTVTELLAIIVLAKAITAMERTAGHWLIAVFAVWVLWYTFKEE